jgi:hypothetical protein
MYLQYEPYRRHPIDRKKYARHIRQYPLLLPYVLSINPRAVLELLRSHRALTVQGLKVVPRETYWLQTTMNLFISFSLCSLKIPGSSEGWSRTGLTRLCGDP